MPFDVYSQAGADAKFLTEVDGGDLDAAPLPITLRRGTTAERDASNPILAAGEPAVVLDSGQPAELVLGDGVTAMADLRAAVWDDDARLAAAASATQPGDLGTAAAADVGDFATAEQGALADTAVQTGPPQRIGRKVLVSNFQTGHGWTTSGAGTVNLNDTSAPILGTQNASIVTNGAGANATLRKVSITPAIDLSLYDLEILVKVERPESTFVRAVLSPDNFASFYNVNLNDYSLGVTTRYLRAGELTTLRFGLDTRGPSGTPPSSMVMNGIQFSVYDNNVAGRVDFYAVYAVPKPNTQGIVTLSFDDLYASTIGVALPKLASLGFPGTIYAIADRIPSVVTTEQLRTAQTIHGWEIAAHAYTTENHGIGYANLPLETLRSELRNLRAWAVGEGWSGADHFAYPLGSHDAATEAEVSKVFTTARTTESSPQPSIQADDPMRWRTNLLQSTTSLADAQAIVDSVEATNGYAHLNFHDLVTSGATGANWTIANFNTLMDYLASKDIQVMTVGDVWRL